MTNTQANTANGSKLFKVAFDLAEAKVEVENGAKAIAVKYGATLERIIDDPMMQETDGTAQAIRNELSSGPDGLKFFTNLERLKAIPIGSRSDADRASLLYNKKLLDSMTNKIRDAIKIHQAATYARSHGWIVTMATTRNTGEVFIRVQGPDDTNDKVKSVPWLVGGHTSKSFERVFKCEDIVPAKKGADTRKELSVNKSTLPAIASTLGSFIAKEDKAIVKSAPMMSTAFAIVDAIGIDAFMVEYRKHLDEMDASEDDAEAA